MSCRWTVELPMRRTWNWRLQSGEDVRRNKSRVKVKQLNIHLLSSISSSPLLSSWCFPADASGQASAETDREVEVHQQSDQNPAQVRRPLTRTETDRLPWLLQSSVSNHICLCFQSSSRNSAPLSELCPPAGSAQTAVSRHTADGQAHHAERRWHTHKHTLYSPLYIYINI